MSFAATTSQILDRSKTVTRRDGWEFLEPGVLVWAVWKAMGLRKGEKHRRLALIRIVDIRREPLAEVTDNDVTREGFPGFTAEWFVRFYCQLNGGTREQMVTRIEFDYSDD